MLTCQVLDSYGNLRMITWRSSNVDMCQVIDSYGSLRMITWTSSNVDMCQVLESYSSLRIITWTPNNVDMCQVLDINNGRLLDVNNIILSIISWMLFIFSRRCMYLVMIINNKELTQPSSGLLFPELIAVAS